MRVMTCPPSYAANPHASRGRLHKEEDSPDRSPFQRDRDRILHANAFRRLKHKTQVFVAHVGDFYRTRLTHSLEVAQIGRSVARQLGLDEDLTETLSLAHDLGHTPFGHAGEEALDAAMEHHGGFDHNAQTLRIVTKLEQRYIGFDGLNLTWESLEGLVKHNGPLVAAAGDFEKLPFAIREYAEVQDLELDKWPSVEAQVAALADDIAYGNHDIDDGMRAKLISFDDLKGLPFVGGILDGLVQAHGTDVEPHRLRQELVRRMISDMVSDLVAETRRRIEAHGITTCDDVRAAGSALVGFSEAMERDRQVIREFLLARVYQHHSVNRSMSKARRVVADLFALFVAEPDLLSPEWRTRIETGGQIETAADARVICDYIAGMTDRFAMDEHHRLFDLSDTSVYS